MKINTFGIKIEKGEALFSGIASQTEFRDGILSGSAGEHLFSKFFFGKYGNFIFLILVEDKEHTNNPRPVSGNRSGPPAGFFRLAFSLTAGIFYDDISRKVNHSVPIDKKIRRVRSMCFL